MNNDLRSKIILSANRALLGEVFESLFAVACNVVGNREFELTFFVDLIDLKSREEIISSIETEIISDFPDYFKITSRVAVADDAGLSGENSFWIFLRSRR